MFSVSEDTQIEIPEKGSGSGCLENMNKGEDLALGTWKSHSVGS